MRLVLAIMLVFLSLPASGEKLDASCAEVSGYVYRISLYGPGRVPESPPAGFGGGLFLSSDGAFLTARHVFEDSTSAVGAVVEVNDGMTSRECVVERVVAESKELDVAIVQVRLDGARVRVPRVAASPVARDKVIGFRVAPPAEQRWRPLNGIACASGSISAVSSSRIQIRGEHFFVSGSSGSPVFNSGGEVVAIALEMVNWNPREGKPDWTYTGLRIQTALSAPKVEAPLAVADFLAELGAEKRR